jgi:hypothetical protein
LFTKKAEPDCRLSAIRQSLLTWREQFGNSDGIRTPIDSEDDDLEDALLFFDAQRGVLTCRVQDVTNSGAGIELHTLNLLPLNFELSFDKFHTVRDCRVIWRQGNFVGVAFQN